MMRRNVFTTYDPNLPMGKKFVAVHVQNEDPLYFLVEVKAKVCELFVQISKFLNLLEPELFGLAIKSSSPSSSVDTFIFLDPLEKLSKYAPKAWKTQNNGMDNNGLPLFNVYFRVQFYVDSYLFISCKVAKYYYYHQLRENVLKYEQSMSEVRCFLLASFALQADYGNYNPKLHKNRYFDPIHYFPLWVIEELGHDYIQRYLPSLHCDHKGMSKSEAQSMFIREASDPMAAHNFHLYKMVSNNKKQSSNSTTNIGKLSFDKKKFEIRSIGPQSRKFIYYAGSEELARFLLWFSRASHQFHLMILPKMREMLKREAEINRRKYRENCISSITSTSSRRTSSSGGNSSVVDGGTCEIGGGSNTNTTSKSTSPFEFSSAASSSSSERTEEKCLKKCITSDLDISTTSSVCYDGMMIGCNDSTKDPNDEFQDQQRVSVISNASSNTTSGIASDKMHSGLVVSMESLAMSEPINDNHHRSHNHHQQNHPLNNYSATKSAMMGNKKHSISISNIMITANSEPSSSPISASSSCSSNSQIKTTATTTATEIIVNPEKSSKVSLCLNINGSKEQSKKFTENDSEIEDSGDEIDSSINKNNRYSSNKSNVTVLSTILKPEAERLLKQGIEAEDVLDAFNNQSQQNQIDSLELAELKEFEQQEKEKIILNSLIDNIPPPPPMDSSDSSDDDDDSSDSSDSDSSDGDDDFQTQKHRNNRHHHYSPLAQEKRLHNEQQQQQQRQQHNIDSSSLNQRSNVIPALLKSKSSNTASSIQQQQQQQQSNGKPQTTETLKAKILPMNHIYENVPISDHVSSTGSRYSQVVQALITTPTANNNKHFITGFPPTTIPLRQYPSLNSVPNVSSSNNNYPHRTGMRIGVSSLSRPGSAQKKHAAHLLLHGGCIHTNHQHSNQNIPLSLLLNGQTSSSNGILSNSLNLSAGSEPNLYFGGGSNQSNHCESINNNNLAIQTIQQQQQQPPPPPPPVASTFRQFIKNQLGDYATNEPVAKKSLTLDLTKTNDQVPNAHHHSSAIYITPPPSADYHQKTSMEQLSPFVSKIPTPSQMSNIPSPRSLSSNDDDQQQQQQQQKPKIVPKKSKESRLRELRQRTSDLNLPLITALFNDANEAIAKSALRQSNRNDANNNHQDHHFVDDDNHFIGQRPISWHIEKSSPAFIPVAQNNGWHHHHHHQYYNGSPNKIHNPHHHHHHQFPQQPQQTRRSSTGNSGNNGNSVGGGGVSRIPQPTTSTQFYTKLRS
ncbi:ferm domain-containing protein [Dermatophagoides farinae]|uniref:Ferm domain-containing protein n=1 Tax=Dermatophagoides farinae TaxID=6954 RepID=A0A9D4NVC5_DERFA|nr:ferm domain-containing protein [Dermatophagoides farinae]